MGEGGRAGAARLLPSGGDWRGGEWGEFVDALRLETASDAAWRTNPAAVATHDYYLAANDACDPCEAINYTKGAYERVATMQRRASMPDDGRDDMEGADDESHFENR